MPLAVRAPPRTCSEPGLAGEVDVRGFSGFPSVLEAHHSKNSASAPAYDSVVDSAQPRPMRR